MGVKPKLIQMKTVARKTSTSKAKRVFHCVARSVVTDLLLVPNDVVLRVETKKEGYLWLIGVVAEDFRMNYFCKSF